MLKAKIEMVKGTVSDFTLAQTPDGFRWMNSRSGQCAKACPSVESACDGFIDLGAIVRHVNSAGTFEYIVKHSRELT